MTTSYIKTHAEPKARNSIYKSLTSKHWQVYYYLMSISKYNAQQVENHRFLYNSDLNYSQIAKKLNISRPTIYKAMERLEEVKLIQRGPKYCLIYWGKDFTNVNLELLSTMINWSLNTGRKSSTIDLLRIYLCLKRMDELALTVEDRRFTKRELIQILGHNENDSNMYTDIQIYLSLLSSDKLIELKKYTEYDERYGKYIIYQLENVYDNADNLDLSSDIEAEINNCGILSSNMKEKLMSFEENLIKE